MSHCMHRTCVHNIIKSKMFKITCKETGIEYCSFYFFISTCIDIIGFMQLFYMGTYLEHNSNSRLFLWLPYYNTANGLCTQDFNDTRSASVILVQMQIVIYSAISFTCIQAIKSKASFRLWILFVLIVFSFLLLFLDWYN